MSRTESLLVLLGSAKAPTEAATVASCASPPQLPPAPTAKPPPPAPRPLPCLPPDGFCWPTLGSPLSNPPPPGAPATRAPQPTPERGPPRRGRRGLCPPGPPPPIAKPTIKV